MTEDRTRPDEDANFVEVLVRDPLAQVTRKERVYLLAVSLIGIAIVKTGLVPSKIATFGIELDQPDRQALLVLLAIVTCYFLIGFVVYAASDFVTRREIIKLVKARLAGDHGNEEQETQFSTEGVADQAPPSADSQISETPAPTNSDAPQGELSRKAPRNTSLVDIFVRALAEVSKNMSKVLVPLPILLGQVARNMVLVVNAPATRELLRNDELEQLGASTSSRIVAGLRIAFEFLLPILVGIYAVYTLLTASL